MSAVGRIAENICSQRVFRSLTPKATFAVKPSQDQGDGRGSRSA